MLEFKFEFEKMNRFNPKAATGGVPTGSGPGLFFNKVPGLKPPTLLKKRRQHRFFM